MDNNLAMGLRFLREVRAAGLIGIIRLQLPLVITYLGASFSLVVGSVMQLVSMAILARALGVVQFGQYLGMMAVSTFALQFLGLGASESLVRRVAREKGIYPVALGHNLILTVLSAAVICPLLIAILPMWANTSPESQLDLTTVVVFAISNTVVMHLVLLVEKIFIAHGQFARANLVSIAFAVIRLAATIVACYVFSITSLKHWIEWQAASYLVVLAGCLVALHPLGWPKWRLMKEEVSQGFFYSISCGVTRLRQSIDVLVLALVAGPAVVGAFGLARRIIETSALTQVAVFRIAYPPLARAMENGISNGLYLAFKLLIVVTGIALMTTIGLYIIAPLCPLLFGSEYQVVVPYLYELAWVLVLYAISSTASDVLGASTQHGLRAALYCSTVLGTVVVGSLTYLYSTAGTIIGIYVTEIAIACGFWAVVLYLARREVERREAHQSESSAP